MTEKFILDPCCGPKHMWMNKNHPNVIYGDIRELKKGSTPYGKRLNIDVTPDLHLDFRDLPFPDESFKLVVFDPPHLRRNKDTVTGKLHITYGVLDPVNWRSDLRKGFRECFRVLEYFGVLILKWADYDISYKALLKTIGAEPLFHHVSGNTNKTYWACFMKFPPHLEYQELLE